MTESKEILKKDMGERGNYRHFHTEGIIGEIGNSGKCDQKDITMSHSLPSQVYWNLLHSSKDFKKTCGTSRFVF